MKEKEKEGTLKSIKVPSSICLLYTSNTYRFTTLEEIKEFEPELVINAATVK